MYPTVVTMLATNVVVLCAVIGFANGVDLNFPPGFKFGVASASYQVEGAWNVSDKAESIWDRFVHDDPNRIRSRHNGDVACDSYHLWRRDIEMIREIGAHFYRFSISWPRLLPNGFANRISEDGSNYYNNLIDGLIENGIEPVVTLYHWDLPQSLQDLGGWTNPLIVDWFGDYSRVVFSLYGDRVKTWLTINEPTVICDAAYNAGNDAPGILNPDAAYICNKNILLAHAKAYRIFDLEFRAAFPGEVSLTNHLIWYEALEPEYEELAELARQNLVGRYSHPIFRSEGGWPEDLEEVLAEKSRQQGYSRSKLPKFSSEEIEFIKGTFDYYGLNFYTSRLVRPAEPGEEFGIWPLDGPDLDAKILVNPDWNATASAWFFVNPEGFRKQLVWLKEQYGDIKFLIMENGYPTAGGLDDIDRINFYRDYLEQVNLAIKEDGVNVAGYTAWTLMDNFEWTDGYNSQFGLYQVDFSSPERTRTPRVSAAFYSQIIKDNS